MKQEPLTNDERLEFEHVKQLLKEAYAHLNYSNYGDKWERETAEELERRLGAYFDYKEAQGEYDSCSE